MTTKHTPGPWVANVENAGNGLNVHDVKSGNYICHTVTTAVSKKNEPIQKEEAFANAQLIAAAPELLAALGPLLARAEVDYIVNYEQAVGNGDGDAYLAELEAARAALQKARGE